MYNYNYICSFLDNFTIYSEYSFEKSPQTINNISMDIEKIISILENHKLFFVEELIFLPRKDSKTTTKSCIKQDFLDCIKNNHSDYLVAEINGFGFLNNTNNLLSKIENLLSIQFYFDKRQVYLTINTKNWLPLFIERKNGVTYYKWNLDSFNQNKGRLEAAFIEIEAATNMLQEYSPNFDRGEYDDGFVMQGRSIYVPRHIFEEAFENQPFSIEVDIADYLAPKEALDFFNEKLMPRIAALTALTQSRPLLAREQLQLKILQSILDAKDEATINAILAEIAQTPTDAELRKILTAQAQAKRDLIIDNNF